MTAALRTAPRWGFLLAAWCLLALAAFAQRGTLAGTVVDSLSGEPLIGVSVVLDGTTTGAATDLDGRFRLANLDAGTYTVVVSYVSFRTQRITGIEIRAGAVTPLEVALAEATQLLGQEVVVEARALRNNEASLLRERARAIQVSDAISAARISQAAASTAADAMQKVTGTSVVGGRYVYVRGLGDRYMNTQLNGATLPSADPDRNAVAFDLFPSELLDNVVTSKTFTPDQPGSFTGGNVNINTRSFPDRFALNLSTSVGYNANANLVDTFLSGPAGDLDWLGYDDGLRDIPADWQDPNTTIPSPLEFSNSSGFIRDSVKAAQYDRLAKAFNGEMVPGRTTSPLNSSVNLSLGNQVRLFGRPLGFVGSLSYSRDHSAYTEGRAVEYLPASTTSETLQFKRDFSDSRSQMEVLWGTLATLSYQLRPSHTLSTSFLFNRTGEREGRLLAGRDVNGNPEAIIRSYVSEFQARQLGSLQLRGSHVFASLRNLRADWTASRALSTQSDPDRRLYNDQFFTLRNTEGVVVDTTYEVDVSGLQKNQRYFRDLREGAWDHTLNVALPLTRATTFKLGGAYNAKDRTYRDRYFFYDLSRASVLKQVIFAEAGDPSVLFDPSYMGLVNDEVTLAACEQVPDGGACNVGFSLRDATSIGNSYNGLQEILAGYTMVETRLLRRLRVVAGARVERTDLEVFNFCAVRDGNCLPGNFSGVPDSLAADTLAARGLTGYTVFGRTAIADTTGRVQTTDLLPALSLVYEVTPSMNLRMAYGRTLARPTMRELAGFASQEYIGDRTYLGNPALERTLVDNIDARWEWFLRPGELLAVSGFYKYFKNPIELSILQSGGSEDAVQPRNVPNGTVYGAEFEARRRLETLPTVGGTLELGGNLTLTESFVRRPEQGLPEEVSRERALVGQSPVVVNLDATYTREASGTTLGLYYNLFGRRLSAASRDGYDEFETTTGTLDVTVRQRLLAGITLRAAAKNVLGADVTFARRFQGEDFVTRQYQRGTSFSVGVSYRIE